jgi:hypothetical protein
MVFKRLREMGIPLVPPETQFLGKNPRAADGLKLPTPKGWSAKEKEKEKEKDEGTEPEKNKDKDKEKDKVKEKKKDKDKDDL